MSRRSAILALCTSLFVVALVGGSPAGAAPPDPADDGAGKQWRQLYETTGLTWSQVAELCPRDGVTPCSGSIGPRAFTGWTWATDAQVVAFMGTHAPAILTANPPSVSGGDYFGTAMGFLAVMRWTGFVSTYGGLHRVDRRLDVVDRRGRSADRRPRRVRLVAARRRLRRRRQLRPRRPVSGRVALAPERRRPHAARDHVERDGDDREQRLVRLRRLGDVGRPGRRLGGYLPDRLRPGDRCGRHRGHDVYLRGNIRGRDGDVVDRRAEGHHRADGDVRIAAAVVPDLPDRSLGDGVGHGCDLRAGEPECDGGDEHEHARLVPLDGDRNRPGGQSNDDRVPLQRRRSRPATGSPRRGSAPRSTTSSTARAGAT